MSESILYISRVCTDRIQGGGGAEYLIEEDRNEHEATGNAVRWLSQTEENARAQSRGSKREEIAYATLSACYITRSEEEEKTRR